MSSAVAPEDVVQPPAGVLRQGISVSPFRAPSTQGPVRPRFDAPRASRDRQAAVEPLKPWLGAGAAGAGRSVRFRRRAP